MDAFSYLSVLLSIIVGLAITQILTGFRGIILCRAHVRMYWPVPLWAGSILLINIQSWWAMFSLREIAAWTFSGFALVLAQTIVQYLLAAIVMPDFSDDHECDLRSHYWAHKPWFFGLFIVLLVISLSKGLILYQRIPANEDLAFHAVFIVMSAIALGMRRERFHKAFALLGAGLLCFYVFVLFMHLH